MCPARSATLTLAIVGLLALSACGGDDGQPLEPAPTAPAPPPAPAAEPPASRPTEPPEPALPAPSLNDIALEEIAVHGRHRHIAVLEQPLDLATRPGDARLYIAEKTGRVRTIAPGEATAEAPFLDLSDRVSTDSERGLLGIAFAPDGSRFYAHYSDQSGDGHLASWAIAGDALDPASEIDHLVVAQPFPNHNGGQIAFGPDGFLYWGLGDGGAGGDPEGTGQDRGRLLGSILRIEPLADPAQPYRSPPDNPFVGDPDARDEIWVWGLRNPWRFSFDADGGLWIGDVGQNELEEVDFLPAGSAPGANLGWDALEGTAVFEGDAPADAVPPVFEYSHDVGLSITGGFVYRGEALPGLAGQYVFGDFVSGFVAALAQEDDEWQAVRLPIEVSQLASFGQDQDGELYALSLEGPVYRLVAP